MGNLDLESVYTEYASQYLRQLLPTVLAKTGTVTYSLAESGHISYAEEHVQFLCCYIVLQPVFVNNNHCDHDCSYELITGFHVSGIF